MNNLEYNLEIIGERKVYTPLIDLVDPIINSKKKIFQINAQNSWGKTFILNLIAFALDANKLDEDRILSTIKDRIEDYQNTDYCNLSYTIELELPDSKKLKLTKESNSDKRIQINDSAPISHQQLHKELSIIYDVPRDPSERLKGVVKDLNKWNDKLYTKFEEIDKVLYKLTAKFDEVRDQSRIDHLKSQSISLEREISGKEEQIKSLNSITTEISKLDSLNKVLNYSKQKTNFDESLFKANKSFKLLTKPKKIEKKDEVKIRNLTKELTTLNSNFKEIVGDLIRFINEDTEILDKIRENRSSSIHYDKIIDKELSEISDSIEHIENFEKSISEIKYSVLSFIDEKKTGESFKVHNSYSEFIDLLDSLISNGIDNYLNQVASIDSTKLKEQLKLLISDHKVKDYHSIQSFFKTGIKPLKGYMTIYFRTKIQLNKENKKKLVNNSESKYYEKEAQVRELKEKLKRTKTILTQVKAVCTNVMEITPDALEKLDAVKAHINFIESKITDKSLLINYTDSKKTLEKKISSIESARADLKDKKNIIDKNLLRQEAKKPSRFNDKEKERIKRFSQIVGITINNLLTYRRLIKEFNEGNLKDLNHNNDQMFIKIAGKIIASSMDNKLLRADGEFLILNSYDMVNEEFHCEDEIVIKKADVSTGLASANYLKQRIDNVEGKYVVVLLDEIGNMDNNVLGTVIDSIKKLDDQNRLVLAAFTKPIDKGIKIIEY